MVIAHAPVQESSAVYWSDTVGLNTVYGKITVTLKSSTEADGVVTRKFEVIEEGKVSELVHVVTIWLELPVDGPMVPSCPGCPSSEGDPAAVQRLDREHLS